MIQIQNITKRFDEKAVINDITRTVDEGTMFGIVGSNGAGKSTLLRLLAGVYKPDSGSISYGGAPVWDNPAVKEKIVFVADELYMPFYMNIKSMANLYKAAYKSFDMEHLCKLTTAFKLNPKASFNTFSKGMRRQAAIALALSARPKYLLLDETFDGLDVVMSSYMKRSIYEDMAERGTTVILSSHSLKELEDCADRLALLHDGSIVFDSQLSDFENAFFKVNIAFEEDYSEERFCGLDLQGFKKSGKAASFTVKGDREYIEARLRAMNPLLLDVVPLSLEETFIRSLEAIGYSYGETDAKI